jgi:hypothetical protein
MKVTHQVSGLEPSVGGHVLASSSRHDLTGVLEERETSTGL